MNLGFMVSGILIMAASIFYLYFIKKNRLVEKNREDKNKKIKCPQCVFENAPEMKYCAKCNALLKPETRDRFFETAQWTAVFLILPTLVLHFLVIRSWILTFGGIWSSLLQIFCVPGEGVLLVLFSAGISYVFTTIRNK